MCHYEGLYKHFVNMYSVNFFTHTFHVSWGCLQNEDRRPKNEDPNFFARIRHGQLKNQAKAFLSANRCENNGDLRFVEKTP